MRRYLKQEKPKPLTPIGPSTLGYETSQERDAWVIAHADLFTVIRHISPLEGYERHEVRSLPEAETLARRMAEKAGKPYLIYAVAGIHDCFVKSIKPLGRAGNGC